MKVAFYKGKGSLIDALIRWKFDSEYSYCELVFSDGMGFSSSWRDKQMRFKKHQFNTKEWDVLDLGITKKEENKIRAFCQLQDQKTYSWKDVVLSQVFGIKNNTTWFCSEFCTVAMQHGHLVEGIDATKVEPQELYELLLQEDVLVNRVNIHANYLTNRSHTKTKLPYGQVFSTAVFTIALVAVFSYFVDAGMVKAFLGDLMK